MDAREGLRLRAMRIGPRRRCRSTRRRRIGRAWLLLPVALGCTLQSYAEGSQAAAITPTPITVQPWQEAVVSVTDLARSAQFFQAIGGYEVKWQGELSASSVASWGLSDAVRGEAMLLGPADYNSGLVRLVRFDNVARKVPTRPGARAWDTGCYFSLMVRMKGMTSIYEDAVAMGWWTETPITYLQFGRSRLNIMIFRGPDGIQVQGYERLSPPLPAAIPTFDRLSGPFNIMQMVRDRDVAYRFFTQVLGFDTFYNGAPTVSEKPQMMPLGIPVNLTTSVRYRASIVYPVAAEFGRMEMIEIMDLDGQDYAARCDAPNLGILAVRFPVDALDVAKRTLVSRGSPLARQPMSVDLAPYGEVQLLGVKTPDGANVQLFERARP